MCSELSQFAHKEYGFPYCGNTFDSDPAYIEHSNMYQCDSQPPMSRAFAYAMEEPSHSLELHTDDSVNCFNDKYDELSLDIAFVQAELELDILVCLQIPSGREYLLSLYF